MNQVILIAGGTGLIGERLKSKLLLENYEVRILTRNREKSDKATYFYWNPMRKEIDLEALHNVSVIVNLSGAGIADKRWTKNRKKELIDSRVYPAIFLSELIEKLPDLSHYISASGINCYPISADKIYGEHDEFGTDFLSEIVQQWEMAANCFIPFCKVTKLRISTVLSKEGGALEKMVTPFKFYLGSPFGNGKQIVSWIHETDLINAFVHTIQHEVEGTYNLTATQVSNFEFSKSLAKTLNKPLIPIGVPSFLLRIVLGQMSEILTTGVRIDNTAFIQTGFRYHFFELNPALNSLLKT